MDGGSAANAGAFLRRPPWTAEVPQMQEHFCDHDTPPMSVRQHELFAASSGLPDGFRYAEDFLSRTAEVELVRAIESLPLSEARYRAWTARRRVISYGGQYDFS